MASLSPSDWWTKKPLPCSSSSSSCPFPGIIRATCAAKARWSSTKRRKRSELGTTRYTQSNAKFSRERPPQLPSVGNSREVAVSDRQNFGPTRVPPVIPPAITLPGLVAEAKSDGLLGRGGGGS